MFLKSVRLVRKGEENYHLTLVEKCKENVSLSLVWKREVMYSESGGCGGDKL